MTPTPKDILQTAMGTVAERGVSYGGNSLPHVASVWSAIPGIPVTPQQVATCMIGVKLVRLSQTPGHADSWIDIAGYAALAGSLPDGAGPT